MLASNGALTFISVLLASTLFSHYGCAFSVFSCVRNPQGAMSFKLYEKPFRVSTTLDRRKFIVSVPVSVSSVLSFPTPGIASEEVMSEAVQVVPAGDVKKLFNEGRAMESQGNILAAQRLYSKVTKLAPRVRY